LALEFGKIFLNILFLVFIDISIPRVIQGFVAKLFSLRAMGRKGTYLSNILLNTEETFTTSELTSV